MEMIDRFVREKRKWEDAQIRRPLPPLSYQRPDISKNRLVKGMHGHQEKIKVLLHHSSRFSDTDFFHYHDFFELIYMYRGGSIQYFRSKELTMRQNDILILNPNTVHSPYTTREEDCLFNILIAKELFEQSMLSLLYDNRMFTGFITDCLYQAPNAVEFLYFPADNNEQTGGIPSIMESLIVEYLNKQEGYQSSMRALLVLLFMNLSRAYSQLHPLEKEPYETRGVISEIISHINRNIQAVSLTELAEHFGYSPEYLSRLIKKNTGQSFMELVQKFRMEKAKYYLETSDLPIAEVMELSGFQSSNYFYRFFKAYSGSSPAAYRKQRRASRRP